MSLISSGLNVSGNFRSILGRSILSQGFTSIGISHYINGALMNSSPGKVLGPFETNRGHAIVELVSIEEFDSTKYESQQSQIRDNIFTRKQGQLFQEWINGLKDNSVNISDEILNRVAESYRRIRNTSKFLLANINGLDHENLIEDKDITLFSPHDVPGLYDAYGTPEFDALF